MKTALYLIKPLWCSGLKQRLSVLIEVFGSIPSLGIYLNKVKVKYFKD